MSRTLRTGGGRRWRECNEARAGGHLVTTAWREVSTAIVEWLVVLAAWGGGVLTIGVRGGADGVLCHVTPALVVGEAALGDGGRSPRGAARAARRLVRLGWLPPGADSPRWQRRWAREEMTTLVAGDLVEVLRVVFMAPVTALTLATTPCGDAACVVHADTDGRPPPARFGWRACSR